MGVIVHDRGLGPEAPCADDAQGGQAFLIVIMTGGSCCLGTSISPTSRRHSTVQEAGHFEC